MEQREIVSQTIRVMASLARGRADRLTSRDRENLMREDDIRADELRKFSVELDQRAADIEAGHGLV